MDRSTAIAVVTVVFPITFLISSLGMAIGVGGGSVLSRALGAKNQNYFCQSNYDDLPLASVL
jgi:Na+-driven multidrug efflux pump